MRHGGYVRNYESVLASLAERGHDVLVGLEVRKGKQVGEREQLARLAADYEQIDEVGLPAVGTLHVHPVARKLRLALDYSRYLHSPLADAPALRRRARELAPTALAAILDRAPVAAGALRAAERRVPWPRGIERFLAAHRPDCLLVTPLVQFGGVQTDYVRAARHLGIPSGLLVASWDNLTNKGLIHALPDTVVVWNETQTREAIDLHGVPPERVRVTGANPYDQWFDWQPQRNHSEFCAEVGLPADRPIVVYLTSSPFIADDEQPFVRRWLAALRRAHDARLREAAVLVRPHPLDRHWVEADLSAHGPATVWPRQNTNPTDEASKSALYDTLTHGAAVVGLNTSAQIESAIVDRPVLTVLDPVFTETQEGTLHFHYLPRENGGPLLVARSLDEHLAQLASALGGDEHHVANRRFLEHFVRPYGLEQPATPLVVAAIEELAKGQTRLSEPVAVG
jgi:hypothetical protein